MELASRQCVELMIQQTRRDALIYAQVATLTPSAKSVLSSGASPARNAKALFSGALGAVKARTQDSNASERIMMSHLLCCVVVLWVISCSATFVMNATASTACCLQ